MTKKSQNSVEDLSIKESWRMFRIMAELTEGIETMSNLGTCVSVFGSARVKETESIYEDARRVGYLLAKEGYGVITGGGPGIMATDAVCEYGMQMAKISDATKDNMTSPSLINFNNKIEHYLTKNLTYSFKYKSMTYEYNEETSEVIPVYMNLSKMTHKGIFNFFNDGLSTDNLVKKIRDRYGKNEYYINLGLSFFYFKK